MCYHFNFDEYLISYPHRHVHGTGVRREVVDGGTHQEIIKYRTSEARRRQMATAYLVLSSVLLALLGWIVFRKKPEGLPPGPYPLPLLGNILRLGKLPHRSLAELARRYGPLMSLRLGLVPFVVVSSPSLAKQVLLELDQAVSYRAPLDALKALDHDKLSVFSSPPGEEWRNLRKICNSQIFSNKRLDESQALRSLKVSDLVSFLEKSARAGEAVDVGRAAFTTTLNLLSTTILSEDLVTYEEFSSEFKDLVRQSLVEAGSPNLSDYFPLLRWLDLQGRRRRLSLLLRKTKDIFDRKIENRQGERYSQSCSKPADFLQALLDAEASLELDRPTIIALLQVLCSLSPPLPGVPLGFQVLVLCLIQDLFIAGSDSSSTTIEWAMTELLRSSTSLEKVRREVAEAMGDSQKERVEESDIVRMPFLKAVVKETLRLHPPGALLPRRAGETIQVAMEGAIRYTIPAGTTILVNTWTISRDTSAWGSDADLFRPERFVSGDFVHVEYRGRHIELIPFGAGRRICPGLPMALRMVHLVLANLLWSFEWKLPEGKTAGDISVTENYGLTVGKAEPLIAVPVIARQPGGKKLTS